MNELERQYREVFAKPEPQTPLTYVEWVEPEKTMTMEQRIRERRIAAGECPNKGCITELDDSGFCPTCGWSLGDPLREEPVEPPLVRQYGILDEYAPAVVDEEAA